MSKVRNKVLAGAAGVIGAGIISWRAFFPWIGYDLQMMKVGGRCGKLIEHDIATERWIINMFEEAVAKHPKKPFVIFEGKIYTYEFMDQQCNKVADIAMQWGLKVGETVAIMIQNEPAFIWTFLGLQKLGIGVAFLNYNVKGQPLVHTIKACEAKVLIVGQGESILQSVEEIRPDLGDIPIYVQGKDVPLGSGYEPLDDLMLKTDPLPVCKTVRAGVNMQTPCCYIFTSGTTGLPKPVSITQGKAVGISKFFQLFGYLSDDIIYTVTPLYHSAAGGLGLMNTIDKGATMVLRRKFSAHHFMEEVRLYNVTVIQYIGELCRYLLTVPESPLDKQHKVRLAVGSGLRRDIWRQFETRFNIPKIYEYFGATEGSGAFMNLTNKLGACGRISPFLSPDDAKHNIRVAVGNGLRLDIWKSFQARFKVPNICEFFGATEGSSATMNLSNRLGACGRISPLINKLNPTPMYLVKCDIDTGEALRDSNGHCIPVKIGEPGLLICAIPMRYADLQFYKGGKEINEKKLVRNCFEHGDLYFNFGDMLELDKDYFVYFKDRIGDTFRWKGENVATYEVANVLTKLDFIHDANVYGVEVPGSEGRAGMAAMHLEGDREVTSELLKKIYMHCKENLPAYAIPLFLRFPKETAMTSTLKQQKTQYRKEGYNPEVITDPLYCIDIEKKTYMPLTMETLPHFMAKSKL